MNWRDREFMESLAPKNINRKRHDAPPRSRRFTHSNGILMHSHLFPNRLFRQKRFKIRRDHDERDLESVPFGSTFRWRFVESIASPCDVWCVGTTEPAHALHGKQRKKPTICGTSRSADYYRFYTGTSGDVASTSSSNSCRNSWISALFWNKRVWHFIYSERGMQIVTCKSDSRVTTQNARQHILRAALEWRTSSSISSCVSRHE